MIEACGAWMPQAKQPCARVAGHRGQHRPMAYGARQAAYRAANKERIAARHAAHRAANKERIAARGAAYYAANKERIAAHQAAYQAANKERIAAYRHRRWLTDSAHRARQLDNQRRRAGWYEPGEMATPEEVRRLFDEWKL